MRRRRCPAGAALLLLGLVLPGPGAPAAGIPARELGPGDLTPGMRVEVRGELRAGTILARRVTLRSSPSKSLKVKGPLEGIGSIRRSDVMREAFRSGVFRIHGRRVRPTDGLVVEGAPDLGTLLAEARAGKWVRLKGRDRGGALYVTKISLRDHTEGVPEIEGTIDDVVRRGEDRVEVLLGGFAIVVDGGTELEVETDFFFDPRDGREAIPDEDDGGRRALRMFSDRVQIGGQLRWSVDPETDLDLDRARDGDETRSRWTGQLEGAVYFHDSLSGFARVELSRDHGLREPAGVELDRVSFRLQEANLTVARSWRALRSTVAFRIGRQDFDEPREWLYDENLDAIRIGIRTGRRTAAEVAVAGRLRDDDPRREDRAWILAVASTRVIADVDVWAYGIGRNDPTSSDDDARWLGLRSLGSLADGLEHWVELGWIRGAVRGRARRGTAFDVGVVLEPLELLGRKRALGGVRPAFTYGYARGSGDDASTPEIDERYRQTGLDDNNGRFAGVTSFKYYGEVLDPELANLEIRTLGAGLRPFRSASVDLVVHDYRQVVPAGRVYGADVERRPDGNDPRLGREYDVVVGLKELRGLELEVTHGVFLPGASFGGDAARARRTGLQVRARF